MENSVATRPRYPVILKHLYMHFYMHNPGAYTPPPVFARASEREREAGIHEIFRRSRRHGKRKRVKPLRHNTF